jgi:hypothetical protein
MELTREELIRLAKQAAETAREVVARDNVKRSTLRAAKAPELVASK